MRAGAAVKRERYILLDEVPQEAYGRIRLGSRMLQVPLSPMYCQCLPVCNALYVVLASMVCDQSAF